MQEQEQTRSKANRRKSDTERKSTNRRKSDTYRRTSDTERKLAAGELAETTPLLPTSTQDLDVDELELLNVKYRYGTQETQVHEQEKERRPWCSRENYDLWLRFLNIISFFLCFAGIVLMCH